MDAPIWQTAEDVGRRLNLDPAWVKKAAQQRRMARGHFVLSKWLPESKKHIYCAVTVNDLWGYINRNLDDIVQEIYGSQEHRIAFTRRVREGLSYTLVETLIRRMDRGS